MEDQDVINSINFIKDLANEYSFKVKFSIEKNGIEIYTEYGKVGTVISGKLKG